MKEASVMFLELVHPLSQEQNEMIQKHAKSAEGWQTLQQQFLKMIDNYVEAEIRKPVEANIHMHEAGGQFRIAFPHYAVRGDQGIVEALTEHMEARKAWTDLNYYHGFPDCCEVHHDIETFIYFQMPLFYLKFPPAEKALQSIEDVAHHIGNWEDNVPDWYDWSRSGFVSNWIGTRGVRDFAPYDYQEANHFRYSDVAMAAYQGTGNPRYMEFMLDYANRWCDHIEYHAARGNPIQCSILPESVEASEMGYSGVRKDNSKEYKVFYSLVSDNTAYDISGHLLDLYWVTGTNRYLTAARLMMDQFVEHGENGRPAQSYKDGQWIVVGQQPVKDKHATKDFITDCTYLARFALKHDLITGTDTYRDVILEWAAQIDEDTNKYDQMMSNLMIAAHFYDGNPTWLSRAYAMALRTASVVEANDEYHQCNWVGSRQGTKFLMETLYQPLLGGVEWGTRGNLPVLLLQHRTDGREGLPEGISFRIWHKGPHTFAYEAVNTGDESKEWTITAHPDSAMYRGASFSASLRLAAGETRAGEIRLDPYSPRYA